MRYALASILVLLAGCLSACDRNRQETEDKGNDEARFRGDMIALEGRATSQEAWEDFIEKHATAVAVRRRIVPAIRLRDRVPLAPDEERISREKSPLRKLAIDLETPVAELFPLKGTLLGVRDMDLDTGASEVFREFAKHYVEEVPCATGSFRLDRDYFRFDETILQENSATLCVTVIASIKFLDILEAWLRRVNTIFEEIDPCPAESLFWAARRREGDIWDEGPRREAFAKLKAWADANQGHIVSFDDWWAKNAQRFPEPEKPACMKEP